MRMNNQPTECKEINTIKKPEACWKPDCNKRAKLRDWGGWGWCVRHYFWRLQENKWFELTHTKVINFFKKH